MFVMQLAGTETLDIVLLRIRPMAMGKLLGLMRKNKTFPHRVEISW